MFILKKGHQPGVYVPLRALFLVVLVIGKAQFRRAMLSCDSSCCIYAKLTRTSTVKI